MTLTLLRRDRSMIGSRPLSVKEYGELLDICAIKGELLHENGRYRVVGLRRSTDGEQVEILTEFIGYAPSPSDIDC